MSNKGIMVTQEVNEILEWADEFGHEYVVLDLYEDCEVLYAGNSEKEALKAKRDRIADTDGECFIKMFHSLN